MYYLTFTRLDHFHSGIYHCEGEIPWESRGFYADVTVLVQGKYWCIRFLVLVNYIQLNQYCWEIVP